MKSSELVLTDFSWTYTGPISYMKSKGYLNGSPSRTLFLSPKLEDIPEQLFALKISKSTNPAKAGKPVFRFLSFRFDKNAKFENTAPKEFTMETDLSQVKATIISKLGQIPSVEISLNINMPGHFGNITCADGTFALFDDEADELANVDPMKKGETPYYVNRTAEMQVKLTGAMSIQGNEYLRTEISTTAMAADVFTKPVRGKLWGVEGSGSASGPAVDDTSDVAGPVW